MRKIVITSGKGGVGKTTVCASLGRTLAQIGNKVVLLDADVGLNNLDVVMGLENRIVFDLLDVIHGKCRAQQALVRDASGAYVLPSASTNPNLTAELFCSVVDSLIGFDFVLIDCPAGIENGFHRAVNAAEEAIIVTTPNLSAIRDADKVICLLQGYNLKSVGLVVNRLRPDLVNRGEMMSATDISRLLRTPAIGVIPEDDCVTLFSQVGRVPDYCPSEGALKVFAQNVLNRTSRYYECQKTPIWRRRRGAR